MTQPLHKKLTIYTLTPNGSESLTVYPRLLKASSYHITKKLFSLMQRQVTVIQSIAVLTTICIVALLMLANLAQTSHTETNIAPAASPKYASVVSEIIPRAIISRAITPRTIMPRDQMEDVRRELNSRRQQMMHMCKTISEKTSYLSAALTNMIVSTKYNVSWCPIYKAASSTWMNYFAALTGSLTDDILNLVRHNLLQVSDIVRQKFPHDADFNKIYEKVSRTKKFLIVRHPLERLLSAYRDKLEHMQNREYYYKRFGRRIALIYRNATTPGNATTKLEPSFTEFLRFIVNEKYFDEHWAPYYRTCDPCMLRYDYILKFETLDRDQNFFIQDTNLNKHLYERNYPRNTNPHGATTRETLNEYIKEIPRLLLDEIYKIYEYDYKLFNYSSI